ENKIRKRQVLKTRTGNAVKFDGAAQDLVQNTVGNGDIPGHTTTEAKARPSCAESGIRDRDIPAASKQRTGVILGKHGAIVHCHVLTADEVEAIVVAVDTVVDIDAAHMNAPRLDDAHAVIGAVEQIDVAYTEVFAAVEQEMVGTVMPAQSARRNCAPLRRVKLDSLAIDRPRAFNRDIGRIHRIKQCPVAVFERRVAAERDRIDGMVIMALRTAEQSSPGDDAKSHVALELDRSNEEHARRDQNGAAAVGVARIDGSLKCNRVGCPSIATASVAAHVINTSTGIDAG